MIFLIKSWLSGGHRCQLSVYDMSGGTKSKNVCENDGGSEIFAYGFEI